MSRILVLANNDIGLYSFRKELLAQLVLDGYEVYISLPMGDKIKKLTELGCNFIETPIDRRGINPIKDMKLIIKYFKMFNKLQPDVILSYTIKPNVYGGFIAGLKKIPYIPNITGLGTSIENGGLLSKIVSVMYRFGLKKSSLVFFQNSTNLELFRKRNIYNGQAVLIPGSGVNLIQHSYEEYPKNMGKINFLFIGRIMRDKGIDELLECAKKISEKHSDINFSIIGDFDDDSYSQKIKELEENKIINFLGRQSDVHEFIKQANAVILPSYHEGIANVLLEAAACGRPVIATDVPGCRETFEDDVTGISCEKKSAESLFSAIEKFIYLTDDERESMGRFGRQKMEKEFDRKIVINEYIKQIINIEKGQKNNVI